MLQTSLNVLRRPQRRLSTLSKLCRRQSTRLTTLSKLSRRFRNGLETLYDVCRRLSTLSSLQQQRRLQFDSEVVAKKAACGKSTGQTAPGCNRWPTCLVTSINIIGSGSFSFTKKRAPSTAQSAYRTRQGMLTARGQGSASQRRPNNRQSSS